jgi:cell division FtsZ-interacting protein ZapD
LKNAFSLEQLKTYLVFWNSLITVINSENALFFATSHSSNVSFFERNNIRFELAKFLNRVQKHIVCTLVYCLR